MICYYSPSQRAVLLKICQPLLRLLASQPDFHQSKIFSPGSGTLEWSYSGCSVRIQPGQNKSFLSMFDAVLEAVQILYQCQPSVFTDMGGQAPIDSLPGFSIEAFIIQVVGSN